MTIDELFSIYKRYRDYADGISRTAPLYILHDQKKREFIAKLLQKNLDFDKFFRANVVMNQKFFLYMSNTERAMTCYNEFDDFIARNRKRFISDIFEAYKGVPKPLNLEDRDTFVQVAAEVDYKIWAILMPDVRELVDSLSEFAFISRIYRFHLLVEKMADYGKIRAAFHEKILRG